MKKQKPDIIIKNGNNIFWFEVKRTLPADMAKKIANVSYRRLNTWQLKGILPSNKRNSNGWRVFNPFDLLYLKIVSTLRESGVPIKKLDRLYNSLKKEKKFRDLESRSASQNLYFCTNLNNVFAILEKKELEKQFFELAKDPIITFELSSIVKGLSEELKKN